MGIPASVLKQARQQAGLSQRLLAETAGVPQSTVARIESQVMQPTYDMLDKLLSLCGWSLSAGPVSGIGGGPVPGDTPTFLWDTDMTDMGFRKALGNKNKDVRGWAYGRLLAEASWREIWRYATPKQVIKNLPLTRFRQKVIWEGLVEHFPQG